MSKIKTLHIFVVNENGEEKIVMWPNKSGINVPLFYLSTEKVEDEMKIAIQEMADTQKLYFELREYQLVKDSVETFYPTKEYNA